MEADHTIASRIRQRREELARRQAALIATIKVQELELAALRGEDERLALVESTMAQFADAPTQVGALAASVMSQVEPQRNEERNRRKPAGVPNVLRMARDILRESATHGYAWVETAHIVDEIRRRWWPDVRAEFIQPQLWRAASKRGALLKDGTRYALPHTIEKGPPVEGEPSHADDTEATAEQAVSVSAGGIGSGVASDLARHPSVQP